MKKFVIICFACVMAIGIAACSTDEDSLPPQTEQTDESGSTEGNKEESMKIKIIVGSAVFTATLQDNATAEAFAALLPLTLDMKEHNRNEKYGDLPHPLPASAANPGTIRNGDIMLYGSQTVVLFYKSFATSYSYTRIGSVEDASGLESALGTGSVRVVFER